LPLSNAENSAQWLQLLLWQSQHMSSTITVKIPINIMKSAGVG
jgi:hypothetical protein